MKKKLYIFIALILVIAAVLSLVGCNKYTYEPVEDFFNISVTFANNGATGRAFSFMTHKDVYDKCVVQLDPADKEDTEPEFNTKDNFELETKSNSDYKLDKAITIYTTYTQELTPDTKYFYRVGSPNYERWSQWGTFTTDDGNDSFSFLYITDAQADSEESYVTLYQNISKAISESKDSEFILSTGDQIEVGFLQPDWYNFYNCLQNIILNNTFTVASGNHELLPIAMQANFYVPVDHLGYYYAFEYGNCLFMVVDTNYEFPEQIEWMKRVIAASTKTWRIIAAHKSPYSSGSHSDNKDVLDFKAAITPFAVENSIDLVLSGHDHIYARTCPIDAAGNRAPSENVLENEINGYLTTAYVKPKGTIYASNRTIGTKFYGKSRNLNNDVIDKGDTAKTPIPVYSQIKIEGNKLTYTAYEYYRDTTKEVKVYDCFKIVK